MQTPTEQPMPAGQAVKRPRPAKRPSLRAAINAKCKDCVYDPLGPGNWRQQVTACRITDCPLWPLRPRSVPQTRAGR